MKIKWLTSVQKRSSGVKLFKKRLTHITQVSPVDVQKMSISDIGPILWMSVGEPRNIPTAETEIQGMSFFKLLSALASATGCSTNIRNRHIPDKITTC